MDSQPNSALAFTDYLAALKRRRALLLGVALPIIAIALLLSLTLPDIYSSSGLIEIQDQSQRSEYTQQSSSSHSQPDYADQYVGSLKGIVLSDKNLRRLLAQHDIYPGQNLETHDAVKRLRKDIAVDIVTVPVLDPNNGREREIVAAFSTGFESRSPQTAQTVANWLVQEFLIANRSQYRERASGASKFFGTEAERMGTHIAQLESKLADFKNKNYGRLPELAEANKTVADRTERDLDNIQLQVQNLRQERVFLSSQLQQVVSAPPQAQSLRDLEAEYDRKSAMYDQSHPDMVSLRRQIENLRRGGSGVGASLQQQLQSERSVLAEVRQRYSADHPDVKRIQRNIQSLEARIAAGEKSAGGSAEVNSPVAMQLKTQIAAIDTQIGALEGRASTVRQKLNQVEGDIVSTPQVEREYQTLTRDLSISRTKYEELLRRQMDAQVNEAAIASGWADEFRLVQPPAQPLQPSKPNRLAIALVGLVLSVIIALTVTLAVEALDPNVRGARDIRDVLGVSALAAIPSIRNSISRRRQVKRAFVMATSFVIGISIVYYVIHQVV